MIYKIYEESASENLNGDLMPYLDFVGAWDTGFRLFRAKLYTEKEKDEMFDNIRQDLTHQDVQVFQIYKNSLCISYTKFTESLDPDYVYYLYIVSRDHPLFNIDLVFGDDKLYNHLKRTFLKGPNIYHTPMNTALIELFRNTVS